MRSKWQLSLFVGLILLLTSSVVGCAESYTQEDLESKYEALLLEKAILKAELETMQADITYLRDASKALRDNYDTLKAEYDTLKADYAISEATSKKLQADYDARKADYDTLKDDYDALKALYDDVSNELAEIKKSSEPEPEPTSTTPEEEQVIKDLAYIKISAGGYTDDADPESDGISLHITFYDSKSEGIIFQGIPVTVTIKLYGYRDIFDFSLKENRELVHQEQTTIDGPTGSSLVSSRQLYERDQEGITIDRNQIKIPYENIMVDQNKYYRYGTVEVTVTTPKQGTFQAAPVIDFVRLYPED